MTKNEFEEIIKDLSSDKCIWLISLDTLLANDKEIKDIKSPIDEKYIDEIFKDCQGLRNN